MPGANSVAPLAAVARHRPALLAQRSAVSKILAIPAPGTASYVAGVVTGGIGLYSSRSQARAEDARQERIAPLEDELAEARAEHERKVQAETSLARYRDPLITATFELQDRIQNLLRLPGQSVLVYLSVTSRGTLALESTLFRFAQYFGWTEIVRREIQFLESDVSSSARSIQDAIGKVAWAFATDKLGQDFMVWPEEQRTIGEEMLTDGPDLPTCIGCATFISRYEEKFANWLDGVAATLRGNFDRGRLVELRCSRRGRVLSTRTTLFT